MRYPWLALCIGCSTASPTPTPTPTPPAKTKAASVPACAIRDIDVAANGSAKLSVRGAHFATRTGDYSRLEVTVTGRSARARLETPALELEGDLDLEAAVMRPRSRDLVDGWFRIDFATPREESGGRLRLDVQMPVGLSVKSIAHEVPCSELTFARPQYPPASGTVEYIKLRGFPIPLLRSPGGEVLAMIESTPLSAEALARKDGMVRVRIEAINEAEGWVDESAVAAASDGNLYGGLLGGPAAKTPTIPVRCPHAVPVFVRTGAEVTQVGRVKANAEILVIGDPSASEVAIDLGNASVAPHVRASDLVRCSK